MNKNDATIEAGMKHFLATIVHKQIIKMLERVAEDLIIFIEGAGEIPVLTANLQDSTGVGIYHEGSLIKYIPRKRAIVPRDNIYPKGLTTRDNIWGHDILQEAIEKGVTKYSEGYSIVIFSAMPYAMLVDLKHDYFDALKSDMKRDINQLLKNFKPV